MSTKALRTQLLAAIAMVLVAAIALGSSTYAWFVGQNVVEANGMQVTAQAENGIVIKSIDSGTAYATTATRTMDAKAVYPTSTKDLDTWYHTTSRYATDTDANQATANYKTIANLTEGPSTNVDDFRVVSRFSIRSASTVVAVPNVKLGIKSVTVTPPASQQSTNLNQAIRVGIRLTAGQDTSDSSFYIYAPLKSSDFSLVATYLDPTHPVTTHKHAVEPANDLFVLDGDAVPTSDSGLIAEIVVWYEGEDENCKASNIVSTFDNLSVAVEFEAIPITP